MNGKAAFQCNACKDVFHQNGLHLSVHRKAVVHICPACLEGSKEIQLTLQREGPGKPYEFQHFMVTDTIK